MRQLPVLVLCLGAFATFGQTPARSFETAATKRVELVRQELQRITKLVEMGALPRLRLDQAQLDLADAQDDVILARTLYGDLLAKDMTEQLADEMLAAAGRRLERQQVRLDQSRKLVSDGFVSQSSLTPLESELALRQTSLDLARSRASLMRDMVAMAKLDQTLAEEARKSDAGEFLVDPMEHFEGNGAFRESRDLKVIKAAFAKEFDRPLPISADGETSLHRALGFDHRGRVDVAVDPNAPEGIWLRNYLKTSMIPYYAFTQAVPGKATAAHIHIGPGSTRLNNAD